MNNLKVLKVEKKKQAIKNMRSDERWCNNCKKVKTVDKFKKSQESGKGPCDECKEKNAKKSKKQKEARKSHTRTHKQITTPSQAWTNSSSTLN